MQLHFSHTDGGWVNVTALLGNNSEDSRWFGTAFCGMVELGSWLSWKSTLGDGKVRDGPLQEPLTDVSWYCCNGTSLFVDTEGL